VYKRQGKILEKHFDCDSHYEDHMIEDIKQSQGIYDEEMDRAMEEDRDRASFHVAPSLRGYNNV
jgi:hypothetical protein